MNLTHRRVLGMTLSAFALVLAASQANAQSTEGDFTFTTEVHWGKTVLKPGQYHLRISGDPSAIREIAVFDSNQKRSVFVAATRVPNETEGGGSYLELVSRKGVNFVHELN